MEITAPPPCMCNRYADFQKFMGKLTECRCAFQHFAETAMLLWIDLIFNGNCHFIKLSRGFLYCEHPLSTVWAYKSQALTILPQTYQITKTIQCLLAFRQTNICVICWNLAVPQFWGSIFAKKKTSEWLNSTDLCTVIVKHSLSLLFSPSSSSFLLPLSLWSYLIFFVLWCLLLHFLSLSYKCKHFFIQPEHWNIKPKAVGTATH